MTSNAATLSLSREAGYSAISEKPVQVWLSASVLEDRLDAEFYQPVYLQAWEAVQTTGFPAHPLVQTCIDKSRVYVKCINAVPPVVQSKRTPTRGKIAGWVGQKKEVVLPGL